MKRIALIVVWLWACRLQAGILFVDAAATHATLPYTNWYTAARTIQAAMETAVSGDTVLVTNGIYDSGGFLWSGTVTRVVIPSGVALRSVNGPGFTRIVGTNAAQPNNVQCVSMLAGSNRIDGFTIENGRCRYGAGIWCENQTSVIINCIVRGCIADRDGGGILGGYVTDCSLQENVSSFYGAAAYDAVLTNCWIANNRVSMGGLSYCNVYNCVIEDNTSSGWGAAAYECELNNSIIRDNISYSDSPVVGGYLKNCLINNNRGYYSGAVLYAVLDGCAIIQNMGSPGGGISFSDARNCIIAYNAYGGAWVSTLTNCTIVSNDGGGISGSVAENCIIYNNIFWDAERPNYQNNEYAECIINYSCTYPMPSKGVGNITNDPRLVFSDSGVMFPGPDSPCINTGTNLAWMVGAVDFLGTPRIQRGRVDMGAVESDRWGVRGDADWDGFHDLDELAAGTDPLDASSYFGIDDIFLLPPASNAVRVVWRSVTNRSYTLWSTTNLSASTTWSPVQTNVPGQQISTEARLTNQPARACYRVGIAP